MPDLAAAKEYYDDLMSVLGLREWFDTGPGGHLRVVVHAAHKWACDRGASVLDEPTEFPQYGEHCYATYWLDPHGIKLEAVCHEPER